MSGLCGIVDLSGRQVAAEDLEPMIAAASYRGRDGVSIWTGHGAAIAHQALHATLASCHEHQPWHDENSGLVVVADARIDDRDALTAALPRGAVRQPRAGPPHTDVEFVAAAVLAWGSAGIGRLLGDFAFVAWDTARRRLFAARDAMGMRPLAYHWNGTRLWFASEVKQVLAARGVPARLSERAIAAHLTGSFDDAASTPYRDVLRVAPGHALTVDADGARVARFWNVDPERRVRYRSEGEYAEAFRALFEASVRDRMGTDRDVGILLSGGVDSGAVASMAGHIVRRTGGTPAAIRTYAWQSANLPEVDERHISDQIVDHFGFSSASVAADDHGPLSDYPARGPERDGPYVGVYQALIERALAMAAMDGVGVMLSGTRGDLIVGETVLDAPGLLLSGRVRAVQRDLAAFRRWRGISPIAAIDQLLVRPFLADQLARPWLAPLRAMRRRAGDARTIRAAPWVSESLLSRTGAVGRAPNAFEPPAGLRGVSRRQRYRMVFLGMNMETLQWLDRLHARAGVAFADPWSDRRLAEFVIASPQWVVQRMVEPKRLAREAMRGVMPESVRVGASKISPEPLYELALRDRASGTVEALLADPMSAQLGFVDAARLRDHYRAYRAGAALDPTFWWALSLEMWLRSAPPV